MTTIGYARVSTDRQGKDGYGLSAQQTRLAEECKRRGWAMKFISDTASGKSMSRPGIQDALGLLKSGKAKVLMVCKLDRVSRSVIDFAQLVERAAREGWDLVILDLSIDTTSPNGRLIAGIMSTLAQWEREVISQRTKEAMGEAKRSGRLIGGPATWKKPPNKSAASYVRKLKETLSLVEVADRLNSEKMPTPTGRGKWHPTTVYRLLTETQSRQSQENPQ